MVAEMSLKVKIISYFYLV